MKNFGRFRGVFIHDISTTFIPVRVQSGSYCGPVFAYMTPVRNFIPVRAIAERVHPGSCTGMTRSLSRLYLCDFHTGTRSYMLTPNLRH